MITLKNGNSVLKVNELGAEMKSFTVNGTEYLWVGDDEHWGFSAPHVFPITGRFENDKYNLNGKEYTLLRHGFARFLEYKVESLTESSAVFLVTANEETKEQWPYDFEFRVCYEVSDGKVSVTYKVTNTDDKTMYFSVGSHDGYATPEGVAEYDILFDKKLTLDHSDVEDGVITGKKVNIIKDSDILRLENKYFEVDALVFCDVDFDSCKLVNRKTGRGIKLEFPGAPVVLVWSKPDYPFTCIEPWFGEPGHANSNNNIAEKENIQSIEPNETFSCVRVITALEGK